MEDGGLAGQRAGELQAHEPPHRIGLVEQILHARITQIVGDLDAVDSQHNWKGIGMAAPTGLGIEGMDAAFQLLPGNQAFHPLQEQLPSSLALLPPYSKSEKSLPS